MDKIESDPKPNVKSKCNICHGLTVHEVLFQRKEEGEEEIAEDYSISWGATWQVIQCRGCESISMKRNAWNSEARDEHGEPEIESTYFPPRIFRRPPSWLKNDFFHRVVPDEIERLMNELYIALQNDCFAASTMLTRAVFENLMINTTGDHGSFAKNLLKLREGGHISESHRIAVESMLEAGHAVIHRSYIPERGDIITLVDILETVLHVVYILTPKANELDKKIPPRSDRQT